MISFLTGLGLSARAAKLIGYIVIPALLLAAFAIALNSYGNSRFREGRAAENSAWKQAQDNLLTLAAESRSKADREDLARQLEFAAQVEDEKERIDEAQANGTSQFDVLFPAAD